MLEALFHLAFSPVVSTLPYIFVSHSIERSFAREPTQRLRERLKSGEEYCITHILLAHLMMRGEDICEELPTIIDLLKSESRDRRYFGWEALRLGFPETVSKIPEYRPTDSVIQCRMLASRLDSSTTVGRMSEA